MDSHLGEPVSGTGSAGSVPHTFGHRQPDGYVPKHYSVKRSHGFYDRSDIPSEQPRILSSDLPEHQQWMQRGRYAALRLVAPDHTPWHPNHHLDAAVDIADVLKRADNPFHRNHPALSKEEVAWFLEGALTIVYEIGRRECQRSIRSMLLDSSPYRIPDDIRSRLPVPLPDEVWERAKDDRPLVDIPERPYEGLIWNVLYPSLEEVSPPGKERVLAWHHAVQLMNQLETDYMVPLAWWRGYRQQTIDHNQTVEQRNR